MVKGPRANTRNPELVKGVNKFSKATNYHKSGRYAVKNKVRCRFRCALDALLAPWTLAGCGELMMGDDESDG